MMFGGSEVIGYIVDLWFIVVVFSGVVLVVFVFVLVIVLVFLMVSLVENKLSVN